MLKWRLKERRGKNSPISEAAAEVYESKSIH